VPPAVERSTAADVPRVGLTTYREPASWGVWSEPADLLPATYAEAVQHAGGAALLLPPGFVESAAAVLDGLDALLLSGGADVDPARYGVAPDPHTGAPRPDRDEWELALARAALARELPILAVCRGLQVLNVALGGTLVQHLPDTIGTDEHCPTVGRHGEHEVRLAPDSRAGAILGAAVSVLTYHHQSVARLGSGLVATGWAHDGTIEAVERPDGAGWLLGVQWHPEARAGSAVFPALIQAARDYRAASTSTSGSALVAGRPGGR
jgi:putative glutamine amidotransferase